MSPNVSQSNPATQPVIEQLLQLLKGGHAHQPFEESVKDLPLSLRGVKPPKIPYTIWQLVEHIRIVQWDILEFSRNPAHQSPSWPQGYWPAETAPADDAAWEEALKQIQQDREAFIALLQQAQSDLYTPFAHGEGQNLLREALLIADHTSYHTGQIILIRRLLDAWSD